MQKQTKQRIRTWVLILAMPLFCWQFLSAFNAAEEIITEGGIVSDNQGLFNGKDTTEPMTRQDMRLYHYQMTHAFLMLCGLFFAITLLFAENRDYSWSDDLGRRLQ
jgi:hypothetical protein